MKIQNQQLEWLVQFCLKFEMNAKGSRQRSKFIKILQDKIEDYRNHRQELIELYATKDAHGEPLIVVDNGERCYDVKDKNGYMKEFIELQLEYNYINMTEENILMLKVVGDAYLNHEDMFLGIEGDHYSYICEEFEEFFKKQGQESSSR
ncbi:DUF1617 family protein [Paenibacillus polymyxa]|uniref:DUF1617 family protein n=1 Tax=Paenibacillus polymyxa TaxID=1406 RepID=UPI002AB3EACC|nr:DUF1617 family protein [Paenibacillus polymyxa]MDY8025395.1 DUF1617 family protein [Paenibacillus polymyxa]